MLLPAEQVIASSPFWSRHEFGNIEFEGASSFCGSSGSIMVPYLDYREGGEESITARCSRVELWCEDCVWAGGSSHFDSNLSLLQHTASLLPFTVPYNDHCYEWNPPKWPWILQKTVSFTHPSIVLNFFMGIVTRYGFWLTVDCYR